MAMCLSDDGDPIRLSKETMEWMETQGYWSP